jgi:hypothetical protein
MKLNDASNFAEVRNFVDRLDDEWLLKNEFITFSQLIQIPTGKIVNCY